MSTDTVETAWWGNSCPKYYVTQNRKDFNGYDVRAVQGPAEGPPPEATWSKDCSTPLGPFGSEIEAKTAARNRTRGV